MPWEDIMSLNSSIYPYNTVVRITDIIGDYEVQGSGVLISPDEVLTASHVVYMAQPQGGGETATNIVVAPAYDDGTEPYGTESGASFHYNAVDDANDLISAQSSQEDYAVIHLSQPFTNLGTMGLEAGFAGGEVNVTGYPASAGGTMVTSQQDATLVPGYTLLQGTALGPGSSGGPVWVTSSSGSPEVVGLVSSGSGTTGFDNLITSAELDQIQSWVAQDDAQDTAPATSGTVLGVFDATTQQTIPATGAAYNGPVLGLQNEYVNVTSDNLDVTASTDNWFIQTGSGTDAIAVHGGSNVLDGGTGSNFLVGATGVDGGTDTFFIDGRQTTPTWDTVDNFHPGDAVTLWGYVPGQSVMSWAADDGAAGYQGATIHAALAGASTPVNGSVTFAGVSLAAAQADFTMSSGTAGGLPYLYVKYTG